MKTQARWSFERIGLSYRLWAEDAGVELHLGRLKRSGQELAGELRIKVNWDGIKTVDGTLHQARFNVSSVAARSTLAKHLKTRTDNTPFDKMDWADALEHLCQFVLEAEREGEPLISMNGPMPAERRQRYDISALCPHGVTTIIYGPGGRGKSIVATALAASIAKGIEIIPGLAPQVMGPVLYLDYETDATTMRERIEFLANGHDFKPTKDFYYRRCHRPIADDAEELARLIAEKGIKFVVIDSCGPAMGTSGDYGDANEGTLKLFNAIRLMGVTTLIVDHVAKTEMRDHKGKVIGSMPYGSVYKVNLARATWELQSGTSIVDDDLHIRLVQTKANDSRHSEPLTLAIIWDSDEGIIRFVEDDSFVPEAVRPDPSDSETKALKKEKLENALAANPDGLSSRQLALIVGSTQGSINNFIRKDNGENIVKIFGSDPPLYRLVRRGSV